MSRFVFIWEMGGGYGHIQRFLPVALQLRNAGHEVMLVLRDLRFAESVLGPHGLTYLQAPLPEHGANLFPTPLSYVQILLNRGFSSAPVLLTLTKVWRAQYALLKPDVLIFDYAPLALFAARSQGSHHNRFLYTTWQHPDARYAALARCSATHSRGQ